MAPLSFSPPAFPPSNTLRIGSMAMMSGGRPPNDVGHVHGFGDEAELEKRIGHALLVGHGGGAKHIHRRRGAALDEQAHHACIQPAEVGNELDRVFARLLRQAVCAAELFKQHTQHLRVGLHKRAGRQVERVVAAGKGPVHPIFASAKAVPAPPI